MSRRVVWWVLVPCVAVSWVVFFFFFNDTATTEIYTLSLHDALPISRWRPPPASAARPWRPGSAPRDRKSTRLNSSHQIISYAVFCLKKQKHTQTKAVFSKKTNNDVTTNSRV